MLRLLIAGAALLWAVAGHAAEGEREFGERLLDQLRAAWPDRELNASADDPLSLVLEEEDGQDGGTINLHRIHGFCLQATVEECDIAAAEFVRRLTAPRPAPAAAALRLIVRDRQYLEAGVRRLPERYRPPHRQIGDDLFAILAFDGPDTITLANPETLHELGIEEAAAWRLAETQTRAILPSLPAGASLAQEPAVLQDREYLSSLLADLEAWRIVAATAGPDLFVTAVADGFVFVGLLPDGPALEDFKQSVRDDCAAQERCISPNVYRFRDGRWVIAN